MAADQLEALEGERGPGTIPNEAFETSTVQGLDADAGVEAEAAAVIPAEHVFGLVGCQEAVATEVPQHPFSDGVLEAVQELGCETSGLVEADASGLGLGVLVRIGPLKDAIHNAKMEMKVGIERRAEAVQKARDPERCGGRSRGRCLSQGGLEGPEKDVQHRGGGPGPVVEVGSQTLGEGEHKLSHRYLWEDMVHHMGGGLGHVAGPA